MPTSARALELAHERDLVFRQQPGAEFTYTDTASDGRRHAFIVAGQKQQTLDAKTFERLDRGRDVVTQRIGQRNDRGDTSVHGQQQDGFAVVLERLHPRFDGVDRDAIVAQEACSAEQQRRARNRPAQTVTDAIVEILRLRNRDVMRPCRGQDRCGERVFGTCLQGGGVT